MLAPRSLPDWAGHGLKRLYTCFHQAHLLSDGDRNAETVERASSLAAHVELQVHILHNADAGRHRLELELACCHVHGVSLVPQRFSFTRPN